MPHPAHLHDLACVVHLHSLYSDGTGTVDEIAAAGRRNSLDVVLLTDHDTLEAKRRGEERWHGDVLLLVGEEVSQAGGNHYLAFGIDEPIDHNGLSPAEICSAVEDAGGFGFAAHPFSAGSPLIERKARGMPWKDVECGALKGIELWSFITDGAERIARWSDVPRFVTRPQRFLEHPPERNVREWDRLCASRRVVAIGGLDAHQIGKRIADRWTLRLMSYTRSFSYLRTHVLCEELPDGDVAHDREQVYSALREGRCFLAMDRLAPTRGFAFWAEGPGGALPMGAEDSAGDWTLRARLPRPASLRLLRDGEELVRLHDAQLEQRADGPGVYRVEARLPLDGREPTWIVSNPIYLRG